MPLGFGGTGFGGSDTGELKPLTEQPEPIVHPEWPASLPQFALMDGYKEAPADIIRRTPMEVGPPKQRPLFTRGFKKMPVRFGMNWEQTQIFREFYRDTLLDGTLPFQMLHPRIGVIKTFRANVLDEQTINSDAGREFIVTLSLEVLT